MKEIQIIILITFVKVLKMHISESYSMGHFDLDYIFNDNAKIKVLEQFIN